MCPFFYISPSLLIIITISHLTEVSILLQKLLFFLIIFSFIFRTQHLYNYLKNYIIKKELKRKSASKHNNFYNSIKTQQKSFLSCTLIISLNLLSCQVIIKIRCSKLDMGIIINQCLYQVFLYIFLVLRLFQQFLIYPHFCIFHIRVVDIHIFQVFLQKKKNYYLVLVYYLCFLA